MIKERFSGILARTEPQSADMQEILKEHSWAIKANGNFIKFFDTLLLQLFASSLPLFITYLFICHSSKYRTSQLY